MDRTVWEGRKKASKAKPAEKKNKDILSLQVKQSTHKNPLFLNGNLLVPSISNSCPWLPKRVRERKGAKSTKISLRSGAAFSKACSSLSVILVERYMGLTKKEGSC